MAYTKLFLSESITAKFTDIGRMNDHLRKSDLDRALFILSSIELGKLMVKNPSNFKDFDFSPSKTVFCLSGPMKIEKTKENVLAGFDSLSLNQACFRIYFELDNSCGLNKCDEEIRSEYHSQIYIQELGRPKSTQETTRMT